MALPMPRPFRHKSGVYYLNVRLPSDAAQKLKGATVLVPIGDATVEAKLTDKAFVSLRTKEASTAKARFGTAFKALTNQLDALRAGPRPLPYKQVVALAGEVYRARVSRDELDPNLGPDHLERRLAEWNAVLAELAEDRDSSDIVENGPVSADPLVQVIADLAEGEAAAERPDPQDLCHSDFQMRRAERVYGREVDNVLARRALVVDAATRASLLREIAVAALDAARRSVRAMTGDFSPDPVASRFPAFQPVAPEAKNRSDSSSRDCLDVGALFERWTEKNRELKASSTLRRYAPSLASFAAYLKGLDVSAITNEHVWTWAEHRRDVDGIAPTTVNRNDLVAVSSVLAWATTRDGNKLRADNPADGVKLQKPKVQSTRPPTFYAREVAAILLAARAAKPNHRSPRAAASRRWVAWICAYTGARVQEVCWLQKEDVWREGEVWILRFPQTKDGFARLVPIHEELKREGFLEFWRNAPRGYLFVDDRPQKVGATRTQQEQRASELAEWVREQAQLPPEVSPNHGWRHTFCTQAEAAGVPKRLSNAITGHNKRKDASDGYVTPTVVHLAIEMAKFPAFDLS